MWPQYHISEVSTRICEPFWSSKGTCSVSSSPLDTSSVYSEDLFPHEQNFVANSLIHPKRFESRYSPEYSNCTSDDVVVDEVVDLRVSYDPGTIQVPWEVHVDLDDNYWPSLCETTNHWPLCGWDPRFDICSRGWNEIINETSLLARIQMSFDEKLVRQDEWVGFGLELRSHIRINR